MSVHPKDCIKPMKPNAQGVYDDVPGERGVQAHFPHITFICPLCRMRQAIAGDTFTNPVHCVCGIQVNLVVKEAEPEA